VQQTTQPIVTDAADKDNSLNKDDNDSNNEALVVGQVSSDEQKPDKQKSMPNLNGSGVNDKALRAALREQYGLKIEMNNSRSQSQALVLTQS
jgi:hypothetical protein